MQKATEFSFSAFQEGVQISSLRSQPLSLIQTLLCIFSHVRLVSGHGSRRIAK